MRKYFQARFRIDSGLLFVTIGNFLSAMLSGVMWFVIASFMPVDQFGQANYFIAIGTIAGTSSLLGLNITFMNYLQRERALRSQGFFFVMVSGAIAAFAVFIITSSIHATLLVFGLASLTISLSETLGRGAFKEYAVVSISQRGVQLALSLTFGLLYGAEGILIGYWISFFLFSFRFFQGLRQIQLKFNVIRNYWKFMVHSFGFEITRSLNLYSDKLLIAPLFGFAILGYYQLGVQFLMFLGILPGIIFTYLLPNNISSNSLKRIRLLSISLSILFASLFVFISPYIIHNLFPHFNGPILAIQIIGLGIVPMTFTSNLSSSLLKEEKSKQVVMSALMFLGTLYILLTVLGKSLGVIGLSIGTVSALTIEAIFLGYFSFKRK